MTRYRRSIENAAKALPYLSRAFFFDNSGPEMRFFASYSDSTGFAFAAPVHELPRWFKTMTRSLDSTIQPLFGS